MVFRQRAMNKLYFCSILLCTAARESCAFQLPPINYPIVFKSYHTEAYKCYLKKEEDNGKQMIQDEKEIDFFDTMKSSLQKIPKINKGGDEVENISKFIKSVLTKLAKLSLIDYQWRSNVFKSSEADRRVEESLARMMGEEVSYLRPMDAGDEKIGPLGRAEKKLVEWLSLVIEEEGQRARMISSSEGELIRPIDLKESTGGPLSKLEYSAVEFIETIRNSEVERARTKTLRPKDLTAEKRGPLGNFELKVVNALEVIRNSEKLRMEQSRNRGGDIVRPIDVPGPLGEMELWYLELITAERQRSIDIKKINSRKLIRPKDASIPGPMGKAEREFSEQLKLLKAEETERLRSFKKVLNENRPMEKDRNSPLGLIETVIVGLIRGPQLLFRVIDRTKELLESETLGAIDDKKK